MFNIKISDTTKRYLISSALTFLTATLLAFLGGLLGLLDSGETLTINIIFSLISGAFTAGLRALIKYLYELLATLPENAAKLAGRK